MTTKIYQYDKKVWSDDEISHTWQFGVVGNKSLFWVNLEIPGRIIYSTAGINILFSLFSSSLMSVDFQQRKFSLSFAFFTDYFNGWER